MNPVRGRGAVLMACLALTTVAPWPGGPAPAGPGTRPAAVLVVAQAPYLWPLDGEPPVTRRFDPPPERWLPGHRGVDLAGPPGAAVRAAGAGVVRFAGQVGGREVVSVDHAGGLRTTYQPVTPLVAAGQPVAAGDPVGVLQAGHDGCPARACLHWGLLRGEQYLDPLGLVGFGPVRLLPLDS
jgi:murein DD-endopeptidase MepM/ murein hydrolase activator NlpD